MFKLSHPQVLNQQAFYLENGQGFEMTILPSSGGILHTLSLPGMPDILEYHPSAEALATAEWSRSILLFPFPNRLEDGEYNWGGKDYKFPINDPDTGNALHGLGAKVPFQARRVILSTKTAIVRLAYPFLGDHPAYPFPCLFEVEYRLDTGKGFRMKLSATNWSSQAIPMGLGWHPYFQLGGEVDEWELKLPPVDEVMVDERMIPTKQRETFEGFQKATRIRQKTFDTCFVLQEPEQTNSATLKGPKGKLVYWQSASTPYLQVFIPPSRQSLALEPMSCNINAFRNGEGLKILNPGERYSISAGVQAG